jgi:chromosome segregation ATPase
LGRLALALEVPPSGAAQIASLAHAREARGPLLAGVAAGAAALEQAHDAAVRQDAARYEEAIAALRKELEEARADLARGQDERRRGQTELDAMRLELAKKNEASPDLLQGLQALVNELRDELRGQLSRNAELEKQVEDAAPRVQDVEQRLAERAAKFAELETELAEAKQAAARVASLEKKVAEADEAKAALTREKARLKERTAELTTAREALGKAQKDAGEAMTLSGEVERLKVDLASAQAEAAAGGHAADAEVALTAEMDKSSRLLKERDEAREVARELKRAATKLVAERDEARTLARSLHQRGIAPGGSGEIQSLKSQLAEQRSVARNLLEDKQLLETRLVAAQRQIELERKRLTRLGGATQDSVTDELRVPSDLRDADPSHTATAEFKAYQPRATEPEIPAHIPPTKPGKK